MIYTGHVFLIFTITLVHGLPQLEHSRVKRGYDRPYCSPNKWPGICLSGKHQSPINLVAEKDREYNENPIFISFSPSYYRPQSSWLIKNNGHSIQMQLTKELESANGFSVNEHGPLYRFAQAKEDGVTNKALQTIIDKLDPVVKGHEVHQVTETPLTLVDFFPQDMTNIFRYTGSLTTPNCAEKVLWTVFQEPIVIKASQIDLFRKCQDHDSNNMTKNYRPIQVLGKRTLKYRQTKINQSPYVNGHTDDATTGNPKHPKPRELPTGFGHNDEDDDDESGGQSFILEFKNQFFILLSIVTQIIFSRII